ncbi:MAG: tetrahydrofolate dehydrogenase/cyclohydrolase catalytic domain-containing protein [Bacillota bacterium]|nr:tetrahydrofolate dehydrogenase/cyclohydrolase catalytic domain-containing protein [Bacillota bacterium]
MARLFKAAEVNAAMREQLSTAVQVLQEKGIQPTLAIVRLGERPDDLAYERGAMRRCEETGVAVERFLLPADVSQEKLLAVIDEINADPCYNGCLIFRPLPKTIDEEAVRQRLSPAKDIDCITDGSMVGVFANLPNGFPSCVVQACLEILDHYQVDLSGKRVTVVGRSLVVGKPLAMLLLARNATVTVCHTRTRDMAECCRQAEVLVVAAGRSGLIGAEHLSPGQIVIDVGINFDEEGKMLGDVRFEEAEGIVEGITPVPGGVGAVTTMVLVKQVVEAARRQNGLC